MMKNKTLLDEFQAHMVSDNNDTDSLSLLSDIKTLAINIDLNKDSLPPLETLAKIAHNIFMYFGEKGLSFQDTLVYIIGAVALMDDTPEEYC